MHRSADLFVSGTEPLPDILRIPGSLAVIFPAWDFRGNEIRSSRPADTLKAETLATRCGPWMKARRRTSISAAEVE